MMRFGMERRPIESRFDQKLVYPHRAHIIFNKATSCFEAKQRPRIRIPPLERKGLKLKRLGSHATSRPPEDPIEFTAAETHEGRKRCTKSLALWSAERVSWRNKTSGFEHSSNLLKEADLRVPPIPRMFKESTNITWIEPRLSML
jgi:hypothetical protein